MAIIHNGKEVPSNFDIVKEKWKLDSVMGDIKAEKPGFCIFNNSAYALDMLHKHIGNNSKIVFHTDVDVDGVGTTYIAKKTLESLGSTNHVMLINRDKVHGIQQKHVEFFKNYPIDLILITDSSSNEINIIKQFNCDVLVIDHHELLHDDLYGYCEDGIHKYVIVNSTIDNLKQEQDKLWLTSKNALAFDKLDEYKGTSDMSCGLVMYELLRLYCECFGNEKLLENLMLFQWAGVTLITDVINTLTDRNQWYLDNTVFNMNTEQALGVMMREINKYKARLDKSYIGYSFAPVINKTIRAGESKIALDTVINRPNEISQLNIYADMQKEAVERALYVKTVNEQGLEVKYAKDFSNQKNIMMDITPLNISPNYSGVIAGRLSGDNNKNAAVFVINDKGLCKGSFRGKCKNVNYRKYFDDYSENIYAQGHPGAFGFEMTKEQLDYLMNNISSIEPVDSRDINWISIGDIPESERGIYHVTSLDEFKSQGYIWRIATGNAKVTSGDEIHIKVSATDVKLKETKGKLYIYDVLGMECKAFNPLVGEYFDLYIEYTNEINMYIK